MIYRVLKAYLFIVFCIPLAGCFKSDRALIDASQAAWPFKRASAVITAEDGEHRTFSLERLSGSYGFTNLSQDDKSIEHSSVLLYFINNDTYIMQTASGAPPSYDLFILKLNGKYLSLYDCANYKEETLAQLGIKKATAYLSICDITELGQLLRLAEAAPDVPGKAITGEVSFLE